MSSISAYSSADDRLNVVRPASLILKSFAFFGFILFSGALQRPIGGSSLQGSLSGTVIQESNGSIAIIGVLYYALTAAFLLVRGKPIKLHLVLLPLILLNVWAICTAFWSADISRSLMRSAGLTGTTLFAVFLCNVLTRKQIIETLVQASVFIVLMTAAVTFLSPGYAYHSASEFYSIHAGLLKGTFDHKNSLAKVLSLIIIVISTLGFRTIKNKLVWALMLLLSIYLIMQTGSAKTYASVPAALLVGTALLFVTDPRVRLWSIITGGIVWTSMSVLGITDYIFSLILESLDRDPTLSARTLIWNEAISAALQGNPLFGGGYEVAWDNGIGRAVLAALGFDPRHAHNGYIMVFVELGFVGVAILAVALWLIVKKIIFTIPSGHRALYYFISAWITLFIVNNASGSFITQPADLYWLMLIMAPVMLTWVERPANTHRNGSMNSGD